MGADVVAIGTPDRWEGAPVQMDPRFIMPEAKSIIAMGFRVMRGSLRGIEEGTFFSNYSSMGYGGLNWLYMPLTVYNLAKYIEDYGYEAIPLGHLSPWRGIGNDGTPVTRRRPVEPGKPIPDVMVHLRIAAFLSGLGEIGWSKMLLTPQFGPRQRLGVLMTEAELEPDPIIKPGTICDRCMLCVKECPTQALSADKSVKVNLAGHDVEWNDIDLDKCSVGFRGGVFTEEGEEGHYFSNRTDAKAGPWSPFEVKPGNIYIHGEAIAGSKGCTRACMIHLEQQGKLGNKFHTPFRRKKLWAVDWSADAAGG